MVTTSPCRAGPTVRRRWLRRRGSRKRHGEGTGQGLDGLGRCSLTSNPHPRPLFFLLFFFQPRSHSRHTHRRHGAGDLFSLVGRRFARGRGQKELESGGIRGTCTAFEGKRETTTKRRGQKKRSDDLATIEAKRDYSVGQDVVCVTEREQGCDGARPPSRIPNASRRWPRPNGTVGARASARVARGKIGSGAAAESWALQFCAPRSRDGRLLSPSAATRPTVDAAAQPATAPSSCTSSSSGCHEEHRRRRPRRRLPVTPRTLHP